MSLQHELKTLARGALRPPENDSAFLLTSTAVRFRARGWPATRTPTRWT